MSDPTKRFMPKVEAPMRNYYKGSLTGNRRPMLCPICKRQGIHPASMYEIARRISQVMNQGEVMCHYCKRSIHNHENFATGKRTWCCPTCEICICPICQERTSK